MADKSLEPNLDVDEIQGNVLGGFNKDYQNLMFFGFPASSTTAVKRWLKAATTSITTLREVSTYRKNFKARIASEGNEPTDMPTVWQNVSFTFQGLRKLTGDADYFQRGAFVSGAAAAANVLGDPSSGPYSPLNWAVGGPTTTPDLLWIVAGDEEAAVQSATDTLVTSALAAGLHMVHCDEGRDLGLFDRTLKGHEHFGFKDGISQPGVRGKVSPTDFLESPRLPPVPDYTVPEFAAQGRPLVCTGEFVIGYARQTPDFPRTPSPPDNLGPRPSNRALDTIGPWWVLNGSFLVFRRLRQDVARFRRFLVDQSAVFPGNNSERFGAFLVGRWRSGAPIIRSRLHDNKRLGQDDQANNSFQYLADSDPNDGYGAVPVDDTGKYCPVAAHIRKVNPRDHGTDLGGSNVTLRKRILRRGIPYGRPLPCGAADDGQDRGLLFLCYQRSIGEQFQFLCSNWMNSNLSPQSGDGIGGFDLLVGQNGTDATRARQCFLPLGSQGSGVKIPSSGIDFRQYVNTTGAAYLFTPSVSALRDVLSV